MEFKKTENKRVPLLRTGPSRRFSLSRDCQCERMSVCNRSSRTRGENEGGKKRKRKERERAPRWRRTGGAPPVLFVCAPCRPRDWRHVERSAGTTSHFSLLYQSGASSRCGSIRRRARFYDTSLHIGQRLNASLNWLLSRFPPFATMHAPTFR